MNADGLVASLHLAVGIGAATLVSPILGGTETVRTGDRCGQPPHSHTGDAPYRKESTGCASRQSFETHADLYMVSID